MQIKLSTARISAPLPVLKPSVQTNQIVLMDLSPFARGLRLPLQRGPSRPFIKSVSFTSFVRMCILFCDLHSSMPNLRYVLGGLRAVNHEQPSFDALLPTIASIGRRTQKSLTIGRQRVGNSFEICRLTAETERLRELLDESDSFLYHLRIQLCFMLDSRP